MLFARDLFDSQVFNSANMRHRVTNLIAELPQSILIFAKDFDGNLGIDARDQFVIAGLNDLRKVKLHARKPFDAPAHSID